MNNISYRQYRAIDLGIWAVILMVLESVTVRAAAEWFPGELYTLTQTIAVICIVMMRWGGYAAIHAVAGGVAFCLMSGARAEQFAVYCIGNCFALAALFLFKAIGKDKIRNTLAFTVLYTFTVFCCVELGRWLISLAFGAPFGSWTSFFAADSLSLLYSVIVVLISRKVDGLFEDQKSYLIRTESERRRGRREDL